MRIEPLRNTYPDRSKYIIAKALVQTKYDFSTKEVYGYISHLSVNRIYVPLKYRKMIDAIVEMKQVNSNAFRSTYYQSNKQTPRYTIDLAYGKRFEPWVISIKHIKEN